jgi:hypothetical protein
MPRQLDLELVEDAALAGGWKKLFFYELAFDDLKEIMRLHTLFIKHLVVKKKFFFEGCLRLWSRRRLSRNCSDSIQYMPLS